MHFFRSRPQAHCLPPSLPTQSSSTVRSPRFLLLWGVIASFWLAFASFPVAAAQVVVGVSTGINNATGQRPARVNINDLYADAGPHWDLYVQALDLFQKEDMNKVLSYYQIAGIHGLPFSPWNGVNQVTGGANSGYCPHGQTIFITWHRPYLALFEQILATYVQKVASQYPNDTVQTYTAAAQTFRIPYWDWATDAHMPPAAVAPTVSFKGPSGSASMRNPLFAYQFPNYPFHGGGFGGSLANYNETKRCITTSGASAGVTDTNEANSVLMGDASQLQDKVYAVFTQSSTFESMATTSNAGASFEEPHNAIHDDIACFSVSGRTGHMGDLNWSGFDPIFMLHHANVDRLFAMWQAINFGDPVFTSDQQGNPLFASAAGTVTADSPLKPFFASSSNAVSDFHTSRSVEAIRTFGYTYPEIDDWSQDAADLANSVRSVVNSLYGPEAASADASSANTKRRRARMARAEPWYNRSTRAARNVPPSGRSGIRTPNIITGDPGTGGSAVGAAGNSVKSVVGNVLGTYDYSVEVSVDRSEIPLPATIELHMLRGSSSSSSKRDTNSVKIGGTSILSMPTVGTSYSITPLRRTLLSEAGSVTSRTLFANTDAVLSHLRKQLRIVIKSAEGDAVSIASVPSLAIELHQRTYTPESSVNEFPKYGPIVRFPLQPLGLDQ